MSFSDNLQALRKANNISQEQLAERLNVTRQTVSKWETGGYPEIDKIIALCNMFGCTMDELITGTITVDKQGDVTAASDTLSSVEPDAAPEPEPEELSYTYSSPERTPYTAPAQEPTYDPAYVPPKQKSGKTAVVVAVTIVVVIAMLLVFAAFAMRVVFDGVFGGLSLDFSGHDISFFGWGGSRYTYANSSQYLAASEFKVSDEITRIDADWINGDVSIVPSGGDEIYIYEIADTSANGYGMMRYRINNGTIYIKFREPGRYTKFADKTLVIEVPEYMSDMISLDISSVSALVSCDSLTFSDTDIQTVSGMVSLSNFSAPDLEVETVSGEVMVNGAVKKVDIATVSGDIGITAEEDCSRINADTVSGHIGVETYSAFSDIGISTVSGDVSFRVRSGSPRDINIDTVSGSIDVNGVRVKHGYSSSDVGGTGEVEIDTTSGDVTVEILSKY